MSVKDVIKKSVYENLGGGTNLGTVAIITILAMAALIGIYMFLTYRRLSKSDFYSKDTNITIACMPVVVAAIMVAMQSNLLVSLGMVGALSIVRFRNAVKNPLDLLYYFWSITIGIICGVNLKILAIVLTVIETFMIVILQALPGIKSMSLLILRTEATPNWLVVQDLIKEKCKYCKEKSHSYRNGVSEIVYEVKVKDECELVEALKQVDAIDDIRLLSYDSDLRS